MRYQFRGRTLGSNVWLFGGLSEFPEGKCYIEIPEGGPHPEEEQAMISYEVDPETVGLLVFEGPHGDIYEGDILDDGEFRELVSRPSWKIIDAFAVFGYHGLDTFLSDYNNDQAIPPFVEVARVIGNIHDHSYLMPHALSRKASA